MASRLRLRGRKLIIGNTALMSLFLSAGIVLILCINMGMLTYEIYLRDKLGTFHDIADVAVPLLLLFFTRLVWLQIRLGSDRYFFRLAERKGEVPSDIFYYFHPKHAFSLMIYTVKLSLIRILFLVLALLPGFLCFVVINSLSYEGISSLVAISLAAGGVLLFFNGIRFYGKINRLLFLADYIFISGEYVSFRQVVSVSVSAMKGERRNLYRLKRSFYGWFMLCAFVLPFGYVWCYYRQTLAVAAAKFLED